MIKIFLAALLCLVIFETVDAAETVRVPANTALWEKPNIKTPQLIILTKDLELKVEEIKQVATQAGITYRNITFYRVRLDNRDFWLAPGWQVSNGKLIEVRPKWDNYLSASGILLGIAILSVFLYFRLKEHYCRMQSHPRMELLLIVPLILFHYAWFIYLRSAFPETFQGPTDENEYFRIANCLRQWDFSKPFAYTIGYPLFCIPFICLINSDNFLEISRSISYFSAIIMMPITIALAFMLIRKLSGSAWKAFISMALYLIIPKMFLAVELPYEGMLFSPFGIWHSNYAFSAYQFCLVGFNSLSEWVSVNLLFAIAIAALYWHGSKTKYFTLGLLFGLALLVRMNNLLGAPFLAYLFWVNDREQLSNWRYLAKMGAISVLTASAVFACQLVVNYIQLGSIIKTPYELHKQYEGGRIGLEYFSNISKYYFRIENLYFSLALSGIFLIRNNIFRNALILWIFPTLLFFFCFNFKGFPHRFFLPVFPGLLAALVCSDVWTVQTSKIKKYILAGIMLFLAIPILPFNLHFSDLFHVFNANWSGIINFTYNTHLLLSLPVWVMGLFYFRKEQPLFLFTLFFGIFIYEDSSWLMSAAMVGLVLYAGYDWGKDMFIRMRKNNV
jgi:hypothetical protein